MNILIIKAYLYSFPFNISGALYAGFPVLVIIS